MPTRTTIQYKSQALCTSFWMEKHTCGLNTRRLIAGLELWKTANVLKPGLMNWDGKTKCWKEDWTALLSELHFVSIDWFSSCQTLCASQQVKSIQVCLCGLQLSDSSHLERHPLVSSLSTPLSFFFFSSFNSLHSLQCFSLHFRTCLAFLLHLLSYSYNRSQALHFSLPSLQYHLCLQSN